MRRNHTFFGRKLHQTRQKPRQRLARTGRRDQQHAFARARGVPSYVIFHDATLREMARLQPTSIDALLRVKGVGARKADDLGEVFLAAIRGQPS